MTKPASDLVEVALVHGLRDVPDLAALVGLPLLLVELLRQRLQLGQGHLQGQAVRVANWRVLQHVLAEESHVSARRRDLPEPLHRRDETADTALSLSLPSVCHQLTYFIQSLVKPQ